MPAVLANVPPDFAGAVELVAAELVARLQRATHSLAAAQWAIHAAVRAGRLRTGFVQVSLPSVGVPNPGRSGPAYLWSEARRGTKVIPPGKPAPFDCFQVTATDALWAWWRSLPPADPPRPPSLGPDFLSRLLAGPGDVELTPREMAFLDAHLRQPVSFSGIQREQRELGHSPTNERRNRLKLIWDFNRGLQKVADVARERSNPGPPRPADTPLGSLSAPKRSTQRGEGRAKLVAALTKHHRYANDSCLNAEPINNNQLARIAGVSASTASAFFDNEFGGHAKYKRLCRDSGGLAAALKLLNGEFSPHDLYGRRPPAEDDRDDE